MVKHLIRQPTQLPLFQDYSPFSAIHRVFNRTLSDFYNWFDMPHFTAEEWENFYITPSVDIVEDKDSFKVEAEMPGMGPEDIKVTSSDGVLTIRGDKKVSRKDENKNYWMREIGYGSYQRSISLPESAEVEKAKASFRKGMLWITIPKKAEAVKEETTQEGKIDVEPA